MQQYLAADKVDGGAAEQQHRLRDEHQPDKADVFPEMPVSTMAWVRNGKMSCRILPINSLKSTG
jgi:hypothetical protein